MAPRGVASTPSSSLMATPTRLEPTSRPMTRATRPQYGSEVEGRSASMLGSADQLVHAGQGGGHLVREIPAGLRELRVTAPPPTDDRGDRADDRPRAYPGGEVPSDHGQQRHLVAIHAGQH